MTNDAGDSRVICATNDAGDSRVICMIRLITK